METFGKCHRVKPESSAGSKVHSSLELTTSVNEAGDGPARQGKGPVPGCN